MLLQGWQLDRSLPIDLLFRVQTWPTSEACCMQWSCLFCALAMWMSRGDRQLTLLKVISCYLCLLQSELSTRQLEIAPARKKWEKLYHLTGNCHEALIQADLVLFGFSHCFWLHNLSVHKVLKNPFCLSSFWLTVHRPQSTSTMRM